MNARSGQALVAALVVIGFLVAVMGPVTLGLLMETKVAEQRSDMLRAHYIAYSGIEVGVQLLATDDVSVDSLQDIWASPSQETSHGRMGFAGEQGDYTLLAVPGRPAGSIMDEESKLNIKFATPRQLRALNPKLPEGAERKIAAAAKDGSFVDVGQMLSQGLLQRPDFDATASGSGRRFCDLVTTFGDGRVNVNTAPMEVLRAVEGLSEDDATALIERRKGEAFRSLDEVRELLELSDTEAGELPKRLTVSSHYFTIVSSGQLSDNVRKRNPTRTRSELRQVVYRDEAGELSVVRFKEIR